jgi:hypothetical protein
MDKILYLKNRIHLLTMRDATANKSIIAKLVRQLRRLEQQ